MPKDTFFNLPEEKREKIIDIALDEFASYDYRTASLSRIVEKAGIAKGSMYQYFDNKKDLYLYIVGYASRKKLEYISARLIMDTEDFFKLYEDMIFVSIKFGIDYPRLEHVGYNAFKENYNEEIGDMSVQLMNQSQSFLRAFISKAQGEGQVRKDIEFDLIAFIISRLSVYVGDYITAKFGFDREMIIKNQGKLPITDSQLKEVLDDLVKFFKTGLKV